MNKKVVLSISFICLFIISLASSTLVPAIPAKNATVQSKDITTQQEKKYGGTVTTSFGFAVDDRFHPLGRETASTYTMMEYLFDPLVARNPYQTASLQKETGVMAKSFNHTMINASYYEGMEPELRRRNGTAINDSTVSRWSVELREGYYWHDGKEVTASDILFTYQFNYWLLYHSETANTGLGQAQYYTAKKLDRYTFEVYSGATGLATRRYPLYVMMTPEHIYGDASTWKEGATGTFNVDNAWKQDWNVVASEVATYVPELPDTQVLTGSGPWMLSYTDSPHPPNVRSFLFERNPNYYWNPYGENGEIEHEWKYYDDVAANNETIWDPCQGRVGEPYLYGPYPDRLKTNLISEEILEWQAFQQGDLTFASGQAVSQNFEQVESLGLPIHEAPEWGFNSLHFFQDSSHPFIDKSKFRRAIDWGMDKYKIVNEHRNGFARPLNDPMSSPPWGSQWNWQGSDDRRDAHPSKARDLLLGMSGIQEDTNGDGFLEYESNASNIPEFRLYWIQGYNKRVGALLTQQIEEIGIPVNDIGVPMSRAWDITGKPKCHGCPYGWGTGPIPTWFIIWAKELASWSEYGYRNHSFTLAVEKILEAPSLSDAIEGAQTCQELFYKDVPSSPMYRDVVPSTWHADVWQGVVPGTDAYIESGWSSRFMVQRSQREELGEAPAAGFQRFHNAEVSDTATFRGNISTSLPEVNLTEESVTALTMSVDKKFSEETLITDWEIDTKTTDTIIVNWNYEFDTTQYENGQHLLTIRMYGLTTAPLEYELLIKISNPVPITQRTGALAGLSGVLGLIIGAGAIFMYMRRKKPPTE